MPVNIAHFLTPKLFVATLYEDSTIRQGLEKMHFYHYTAVPVTTRENIYVGTVSEGDFLWYLMEKADSEDGVSLRDMEDLLLRDILKPDRYPPVPITVTVEELLTQAMNRNFIPVVDGRGAFIGIVTRKAIMQYFADPTEEKRTPAERICPDFSIEGSKAKRETGYAGLL